LSFAQRRLWFLNRLEGPNASYTIPLALRLSGALDREALRAALGDLIERHESLRTTFPDTLGVPRQQILDASAARPKLVVTSVTETGLAAAFATGVQQGFDLTTARRCELICLHSASMNTCCWCCITLPATAGRWRR
jgi:hypothetical protein